MRAGTNLARVAARLLGPAIVAATVGGAFGCNGDDPFVTYIGVVDATPPRLGRPLTSVPLGDGGVADGGSADQNTGPGDETTDGSAPADGELSNDGSD
jgi:hypothetical protein